MARYLLSLLLLGQAPQLFSQMRIADFRANALSYGYGGSLVAQVRDPSAIFWNPALLSGLKYRAMLISINEPFGFDFVGLTHYVPLVGTLGAAFSRMSDSTSVIDGGTLAWGRKVFRGLTVGSSFTMNKQDGTPAASLALGMFLGNAELSTLQGEQESHSRAGFWERFGLGATVQGLPLSKELFDPALLFGFSYLFGSRLLLNTGYHLKKTDNSFHAGLGLKLTRHFTLFAGSEDFDLDKLGVGLGYAQHNFLLNASYSRQLRKVLVTLSTRISPKVRDLAEPLYQRGRSHFKAGADELADSELRKYLSYDLTGAKTDTARSIVHYLKIKLMRKQIRVDSLFAQAQRFLEQKKPQILRAAYSYTRILELDPKNLKARIKLAALKPRVDSFVKRWMADGIYEFDVGEYEKAQLSFKKVLLFRKNDPAAQNYLQRIDQFYADLGQEHFFRGVGFLSNRNYDRAKEEFNLALKYNPEMQDAKRYLTITDERYKQHVARVDSLHKLAAAFTQANKLRQAIETYRQVLAYGASNGAVKKEIGRLESKLREQREGLVKKRQEAASYFSRAEAAFEKMDWQGAYELDSAGLRISPNNAKALARRRASSKNLQAQSLISVGRLDFNDRNYREALTNFQRAVDLDPDNTAAKAELMLTQKRIDELVKIYFDEGIDLYTQDKYQEAIAKWEQALSLDPNHKSSLEYQAQAQERIKALRAIKK